MRAKKFAAVVPFYPTCVPFYVSQGRTSQKNLDTR